ncbi:hypothetical protein ZIOFF_017333 [Zingiber officinale]|uniref:Uncharacterized protein n=1 Tax=Zingiber officinale TaxID=94328 RepID=A0A8J5HJH8_ZINOF|nr:hypothetical protein ZIOFF_017333 [Zingiber officinale]
MYVIVEEKVLTGWNKKKFPLHCLTYTLIPKYYGEEYLQLPAPGCRKRCPPDQDDEAFEGAIAAICKMHPNADRQDVIRIQFLSFIEKKGKFSSPIAKRDARNPKNNVVSFPVSQTSNLHDLDSFKRNSKYKYAESVFQWEDLCFMGLDDADGSLLKHTSHSSIPIQELLRIIEDVPSADNPCVQCRHRERRPSWCTLTKIIYHVYILMKFIVSSNSKAFVCFGGWNGKGERSKKGAAARELVEGGY